jgi:hypothetical protein
MFTKTNIAAVVAILGVVAAPIAASAQSYFVPETAAGQNRLAQGQLPTNAYGAVGGHASNRVTTHVIAPNGKEYDVYTAHGNYAGRDPDAAIRSMMLRDGPGVR